MNESRPPMTKTEFLNGYVPIWVDLPDGRRAPIAFMKNDVVRWVITTAEQRMWSTDVIAKDKETWDERIWPYVKSVEVIDLVANKIYHISAQDFQENKSIVHKGGGPQYVVRRCLWAQELLTMYPSRD